VNISFRRSENMDLPMTMKKIKDKASFKINYLTLNKYFDKYEAKIKKLKDIHKDERCFIVGTGPSLKETNLSLLKNEIVFGVNSLYKAMDDFSCKYYAISDIKVWNNHKKKVSSLDTLLFLSSEVGRKMVGGSLKNTIFLKTKGYMSVTGEFSKDISKYVVGGHTVVIDVCLQVCFYMGFKEVYLLGCDCDYSGTQHFDGSESDNKKSVSVSGDWSRLFHVYEICKNTFEKDGRKIYNSTVGGKLEVFERKKLEEVVK